MAATYQKLQIFALYMNKPRPPETGHNIRVVMIPKMHHVKARHIRQKPFPLRDHRICRGLMTKLPLFPQRPNLSRSNYQTSLLHWYRISKVTYLLVFPHPPPPTQKKNWEIIYQWRNSPHFSHTLF